MNSGSRCWASLPADALAYIINECGFCQNDVASIRLVCVHWRATTNSHLRSLAPACTSLEQVAGIAQRFPFLTNCDLTRCDTRLVDHASLCRDASVRLSTLLAALSRMPSLTSLHISDTFSERMGQKHWASLVCAQALVDGTQPSGPSPAVAAAVAAAAPLLEAPAVPWSRDDAAGAAAAGGAGTSAGGAAATAVSVSTVAGVGAALAAVRMGPVTGGGAATAASSPVFDGELMAAAGGGSGGGGAASSCLDSFLASPISALVTVSATTATITAITTSACSDGEEDGPVDDPDGADDTARRGVRLDSAQDSIAIATAPATDVVELAEGATAGVDASPPPPPPPPPPLVLDASELADPGIKSFTRAISRPGATHQHAFWLPDWCGRLAGLQELHIRGRQRPSAGLPPCLLWLHAGRTAPQLTSLSLVRLSLVTLPEQLQHLRGLTRLVAQDCSLSLMPRGVAGGLSKLQYMDLSLNGLTALPADFTELISLKHLDLQRNKLVALPGDIGRLSSVTCLLLNNNQLRQLPASLSALRHIEVLSCSYNWLGGMGPSLPLLCNLPRLRRLELACVSDVRCRVVPPQELRLLAANLTHLDLAANNLVPSDVLGTLTSVRSLVLSDCGLLAVPPWVRRLAPSLQHLDLSNNSLSELPAWLAACTRLRYISIAHNRLSLRVPPSVLEQMPQLEVMESE